MSAANFGETMAAWARDRADVGGLVLIGSQVRAADDQVWRADAQSDWDFQIIASDPRPFADAGWTQGLDGIRLKTYAARMTRIGRVPKVNAIFEGAEADFVVLPQKTLRLVKILVALGFHRKAGGLRRSLQDLAIIIRPGWRFLKGAAAWEPFYRKVTAEVSDPRLDDGEARRLADGFVCDHLWTLRKLERGELAAAQRMLHQSLAETNFRLLHEIRLRRGERSFPEARRLERVAGADLAGVSLSAPLDPASLRAAAEKSAATCRELMRRMVGDAWRWPG